jgi:hypothetical protein
MYYPPVNNSRHLGERGFPPYNVLDVRVNKGSAKIRFRLSLGRVVELSRSSEEPSVRNFLSRTHDF